MIDRYNLIQMITKFNGNPVEMYEGKSTYELACDLEIEKRNAEY